MEMTGGKKNFVEESQQRRRQPLDNAGQGHRGRRDNNTCNITFRTGEPEMGSSRYDWKDSICLMKPFIVVLAC
jgi:hypothetical protein